MHVLKQLNLSAEQQTQIRSILAASKPQFQSLGAGMRSNAEAMAAMSPTDPGYHALLAAAKASAAARIQQMSDVKAQVFAVLTPAQCARLEKRVLPMVKGRSKGRLETLVDREVVIADPGAAENRRIKAVADRAVSHRPMRPCTCR